MVYVCMHTPTKSINSVDCFTDHQMNFLSWNFAFMYKGTSLMNTELQINGSKGYFSIDFLKISIEIEVEG